MTDIVDFIAGLTFDDIPEQTVNAAQVCLFDAVGCMVGGMQYPAVVNFAKTVSKKNPGATKIAGSALTSTRAWSSFINTHACTFFDLDDGHRRAQGHPGGVIIPLSLMLAAENGSSGKELIAAIVAGYETAIRSALIMRQAGGPRKGSGGWSITGGVAAAAKLCRLSPSQIRSALGLAEYYAPQAPQDRSLAFPSSMKEGMAWASHSAITVVNLAAAGFDSMSPFLSDDPLCDDLGLNWEICSVYYKMYACCRFSHPVLDGLRTLVREHDIQPEDIEEIRVMSFAKALLLNHVTPANPVAAMYSIPFIVGCYLVKGRVGPKEMAADTLSDIRVLEIARKVVLEEDSDITDQFPEKCLARIRVTLKDGKTIESETLSAKGDPDNPYTQEEMRTKFLDLTMPLIGKYAETLFYKIKNIDQGSPQDIWDILQAGVD